MVARDDLRTSGVLRRGQGNAACGRRTLRCGFLSERSERNQRIAGGNRVPTKPSFGFVGEEAQRSEGTFAAGGSERYAACADEGSALLAKFYPRTPITGNAESVRPVYHRRVVTELTGNSVSAQPLTLYCVLMPAPPWHA